MVFIWLLYGYYMVIIWLFYGYYMVILSSRGYHYHDAISGAFLRSMPEIWAKPWANFKAWKARPGVAWDARKMAGPFRPFGLKGWKDGKMSPWQLLINSGLKHQNKDLTWLNQWTIVFGSVWKWYTQRMWIILIGKLIINQ